MPMLNLIRTGLYVLGFAFILINVIISVTNIPSQGNAFNFQPKSLMFLLTSPSLWMLCIITSLTAWRQHVWFAFHTLLATIQGPAHPLFYLSIAVFLRCFILAQCCLLTCYCALIAHRHLSSTFFSATVFALFVCSWIVTWYMPYCCWIILC